MRSIAVLLLAVWPSLAHADASRGLEARWRSAQWAMQVLEFGRSDLDELRQVPQAIYDDLMSNPLTANVVSQYRGGYARVAASAGASTDFTSGAAATAAAEMSLELPLCRILGAAASGELGYGDGDPLSAWAATGSGCIPFPGNTLFGSYTRAENVRRSLFDRTRAPGDRVTTDVVDVHVRFWRYLGERHVVDVVPIAITAEQTSTTPLDGVWSMHVTMELFAWSVRGSGLADRDRTLRVLSLDIQSIFADGSQRSADVAVLAPVRVENLRLSSRLAISGSAGWLLASTHDRADPQVAGPMGQRITPARLDVTTLYADGTATVDTGVGFAAVQVTRSAAPLLDGQLLRDDRIAASFETARGTLSGKATGFVALQRLLRDNADDVDVHVGGGTLEAAWAVKPNLVVVGRSEAGRTLTALTTTDAPRTAWDVRATLGIQAHFEARTR